MLLLPVYLFLLLLLRLGRFKKPIETNISSISLYLSILLTNSPVLTMQPSSISPSQIHQSDQNLHPALNNPLHPGISITHNPNIQPPLPPLLLLIHTHRLPPTLRNDGNFNHRPRYAGFITPPTRWLTLIAAAIVGVVSLCRPRNTFQSDDVVVVGGGDD